jgi:hypothetical protein
MSLADDFEVELWLLCDRWDQVGIYTARLRENIEQYGAVETARRYGATPKREGFQEGLKKALQHFGPDQTIEGLMIDERFRELFEPAGLAVAEARLADPS